MGNNLENNRNGVINAFKSLVNEVDNSNLKNSEKELLKRLINKLIIFYSNKYDEIIKHDSVTLKKKLSVLQVVMTDYIVAINDTVIGKNDVYAIVNMVNKDVNDGELKKELKKKRI